MHALAVASPVFQKFDLERFGLRWVEPTAPLAHPLDGGRCVLLQRSLRATCEGLGRDGPAYFRLMSPLLESGAKLLCDLLSPLHLPSAPGALLRFGLNARRKATSFCRRTFQTEEGRALFAGNAGHSILPLDSHFTAGFGLVLQLSAHAVGWPLAAGGSQSLGDALTAYFLSLGGEVIVDRQVESLDELPAARAYLFDLSPEAVVRIAGDHLPRGYRRRLARYRHGPGVFKMDFALDGPIPWEASAVSQAATVHLGGTLEEIATSEEAAWSGEDCERPFVLLVQPSLFDSSRAPRAKHVAWAYCHVPASSELDWSSRIENQIERFAPGFQSRILDRSILTPAGMEGYNSNYVGGDITGGANHWSQLFTRPVASLSPWSTPNPKIFICSASTPPGGGVHGMCGYFAARAALRRMS